MNYLVKKTVSVLVLAFLLIPIMVIPVLAANYTVQSGDNLFKIGQKFGVSHQEIMKANGLSSSLITPGMNLYIPERKTESSFLYTVQAGDTLFLLAKKYGTTVQAIKDYNGLKQDKIIIGQKLRIPTGNTVMASRSSGTRFTEEEIYLMARAVYGEARGEPYTGQVAVAAVILNRLESPEFPNTVRDVIFQPEAFTAVQDGQFWLTPNATAIRAVRDAINGYDPTGGALYYWNPQTATNKWIWSRSIIKQIGKHVFGV